MHRNNLTATKQTDSNMAASKPQPSPDQARVLEETPHVLLSDAGTWRLVGSSIQTLRSKKLNHTFDTLAESNTIQDFNQTNTV